MCNFLQYCYTDGHTLHCPQNIHLDLYTMKCKMLSAQNKHKHCPTTCTRVSINYIITTAVARASEASICICTILVAPRKVLFALINVCNFVNFNKCTTYFQQNFTFTAKSIILKSIASSTSAAISSLLLYANLRTVVRMQRALRNICGCV